MRVRKWTDGMRIFVPYGNRSGVWGTGLHPAADLNESQLVLMVLDH